MLTDKEKQELQKNISSNAHEVYVISFEEMDAIITAYRILGKFLIQTYWEKIKANVGYGASYYASADDIGTLAKLVGDLGGVGTRAYIKSYGGKPHIVLKGHPGLRKVLTSPKYGIKNPKVISMGLGKSGALAAAKNGGIITVVLLTGYRVLDYFLTDQATLSQLVGTLATDVVKVGLATGAAILIASSSVVATFAIGPIVAVVLVGIGVSALLEHSDNRLGITKRVVAALDEVGDDVNLYFVEQKKLIKNKADKTVESVIDVAVESAKAIAVAWVRKTVKDYLNEFSLR